MYQRRSFILAAVFTAFILMVIGGLSIQMSQQSATAPATSGVSDSNTATDPAADLQNQIAAREAAYQQALAEANTRLQQANSQLSAAYARQQQLADQLSQTAQQLADLQQSQQAAQTAPDTSVQAASPSYNVSAEVATQLALAYVPNSTLQRIPQLVSFKGTPAYEVVLNQGNIYIDANSGQVLYDATVTTIPSTAQYSDDNSERSGADD
jgi:uncharacterized membrane protein YkoI